jgi:hypothetical protein
MHKITPQTEPDKISEMDNSIVTLYVTGETLEHIITKLHFFEKGNLSLEINEILTETIFEGTHTSFS